MEVLYERCCGIDVHKSSVAACIVLDRGQKPRRHLRRFGCTTHELRELAEWLRSFDVRHVAMESTGVYWKPVWNVLEEHFHMVLANAQHIKAVPGRKTDMMDCQWIAELLRHGLLRGSYVPSAVIRDLRDLTRTRATLSQEQSGISSRIQKLLESANIKLASTVTHTMGKSGQAILDAIVNGEDNPERLADLALGKLRSKIPQLQLALDGRIRDHHRFLLDSLLRQYRFLEAEIQALDTRLEQLGEQHQELADTVARWITVPGVERVAAWTLVLQMNLPEGYLLQVLQEQFGPHIGASPMALLSVIGRNMVGRIQVAAAGAELEEPAKPIEVTELLQGDGLSAKSSRDIVSRQKDMEAGQEPIQVHRGHIRYTLTSNRSCWSASVTRLSTLCHWCVKGSRSFRSSGTLGNGCLWPGRKARPVFVIVASTLSEIGPQISCLKVSPTLRSWKIPRRSLVPRSSSAPARHVRKSRSCSKPRATENDPIR